QAALDNAVEEFDNEGGAWFSGEGDPAEEIGNVGDFYLDEETGDYYKKTDEGWEKKGDLNGNDGDNGEDGATWLVGEDEPGEDEGNIGDLYLENDTGNVYLKKEDGW